MNPELESFIASCFPDQDSDTTGTPMDAVTKAATIASQTRPRWDAMNVRHMDNQGGMVVDEGGDLSLRPGHPLYDHSIGASVVLSAGGKILLTAPNGIGISGAGISSYSKPSQLFRFLGGRYQLNPALEDSTYFLTPKVQTEDFNLSKNSSYLLTAPDLKKVFVLMLVENEMIPVPILEIFDETPLYTPVNDDQSISD